MKNILLKTFVFLFFISCSILMQGQVGIQTIAPVITLDVESKPLDVNVADGIIMPRLTRAQLIAKDARYGSDQTSAIVYITAIDGTVSVKTEKVTKVGYYYFDGSIWQSIDQSGMYFYLPPFELPTSSLGTGKTFDLYANVLSKQFAQLGNTSYETSNSVLVQLPPLQLPAAQFDYVITYYDTDVIKVNSISTSGVINYDVLSTFLGSSSFVNIVAIVK